ncbi:hypothetical protein ABZZ79_30120 [Streptomyces sp. NPDC006458]|uniref:hypothetical protein n=1 Tax=Streptomyces sp. NPDC006458 TaxID=3154302 RepID=UPI0033AC064F
MAARRLTTCLAASAALLLTPCLAATATASDGDDLSARELAGQARDNLLDAESVHLKLTDRSKGMHVSRTQPTSLDLALDRDGNCAGEMEMGRHGGTLEIVKQGDEVWMQPDTDFWKAQVPGSEGDAVADLFENRWIHGSTDDALLKGMADTCDLKTFQKDIGAGNGKAPALSKGDKTERGGTEVFPLTGSQEGTTVTMYVTADSPHRAVLITQRGAGTNMSVAFTDYDKPVPSRTPPPDDSVDVSELEEELRNV